MKFTCEIVQDLGTYYANLFVDNKQIMELPEYVDYKTLAKAIRQETGICIPKRKDMLFEKIQRKYYAMIDNTQVRSDCRVTLAEIKAGYKPDWA